MCRAQYKCGCHRFKWQLVAAGSFRGLFLVWIHKHRKRTATATDCKHTYCWMNEAYDVSVYQGILIHCNVLSLKIETNIVLICKHLSILVLLLVCFTTYQSIYPVKGEVQCESIHRPVVQKNGALLVTETHTQLFHYLVYSMFYKILVFFSRLSSLDDDLERQGYRFIHTVFLVWQLKNKQKNNTF